MQIKKLFRNVIPKYSSNEDSNTNAINKNRPEKKGYELKKG